MKGGSAKNTDSFPESGVEVIDLGEDTSLNLKNKMKITDRVLLQRLFFFSAKD